MPLTSGAFFVLQGADPTGATECSSAFVNALSALSAIGGGVLYVPPGTYTIYAAVITIPSGVTIQGAGRGITNLYCQAQYVAQSALLIDGSTTGKTNITIRDLSLFSDSTATYPPPPPPSSPPAATSLAANGIYIITPAASPPSPPPGNADIAIENCELSFFALTGIGGGAQLTPVDTQRFHIRRCSIHDIGTPAMSVSQPVVGIQGIQCTEAIYTDNDFYNIGKTNTDFGIYEARASTAVQIVNNRANNCSGGFQT